MINEIIISAYNIIVFNMFILMPSMKDTIKEKSKFDFIVVR